MAEEKVKILLCGDTEGKFQALFNKVENINKKSGPFDLVLCVGNFFGVNNKELEPFKNGTKKVSVSTYILGPNKEDASSFYTNESEICPNVYYLGKRGLYVTSNGLKIAYLSGVASDSKTPKSHNFTIDDALALRDVCVRGADDYRGVDILLTSQWPNNPQNLDVNKDNVNIPNGSDIISWLVMHLKPRYHVCGLEGVYYERHPYRIPSNPDGCLEAITRFISLGRVGNQQKLKWIYALQLMPIDKMKLPELLQRTTDETGPPYNTAELFHKIWPQKRHHEAQQYFYDMNAPEDTKHNKKGKRQRMEFDQSKCWFCLASPSVEKHLIITVGTNAYVALAKGGIVEEHLLICPIQHYQCAIGQPDDVLQEIEKFKEAVTAFYARNDEVPVFFERNYKTSHMQVQCIPIPKPAQRELEEIFQEEAEGNGFKFEELDDSNRLEQVVPTGAPYFLLDLPNGKKFYTRIQGSKGFPINFGREVLAMEPILNKLDRIEWKDCTLSREDEDKLIKKLRTDFEPFDITD